MQRYYSLKEVISSLQHTFVNIDIRGVVAKKSERADECNECDEWTCIFLKIRLTMDNKSKVLEVHKKRKRDLALKNNDKFKLLAQCRDIDNLNSIIEEMQKGQITIEGLPLKLLTTEINIYGKRVETYYNGYSSPEENSGYNHWFIFASYPTGGGSTYKAIQDLGLTPDDMDIEYELIAQWLDITQDQWIYNYSNFVIIIPIYIKKIGISRNENKIWIEYEIHKSLLNECVLRKTLYGEEIQKFPDIPLRVLQLKELQELEIMAVLKVDIKATDFSKNEKMKIAIIHNAIRQLYCEDLSISNLTEFIAKPKLSYLQELMQQVTTQFKQNSNLSEYSRNALKIDPFEGYVYYLFNQLFLCIWFGLFENTDPLKKVLASNGITNMCDFLLLDSQRKGSVILIECTRQFLGQRAITAEYEIGKLTSIRELVRQQGYNDVYAVLACSEQYSTNPTLFSSVIQKFGNEVYYFFQEELEEIQSNTHAITKHTDVIKLSRNKIQFSNMYAGD